MFVFYAGSTLYSGYEANVESVRRTEISLPTMLNKYNKTMSIVLDTHKCRAYCCYRVESGAVTTDQSGQVLVWAERYSNDYVFGLI